MHIYRNDEGRAGPVEQPITWDDENVAAPERQDFFCLYRNQMLLSLMAAVEDQVYWKIRNDNEHKSL